MHVNNIVVPYDGVTKFNFALIVFVGYVWQALKNTLGLINIRFPQRAGNLSNVVIFIRF
jgi:hypothetical protein